MKIPVCGMDPSLTNWGIAEAQLDLISGELTTPSLSLVSPVKDTCKQVRRNSTDLDRAEQLAQVVFSKAKAAKIVFAEVPVGSQSARAMASYGICVGILAALRAQGVQIIEVTAQETKVAFTGLKNASKQQMIDKAIALYPDANFPLSRGKVADKAEHVADAIATIHSGVLTPMFKNLMRLYAEG